MGHGRSLINVADKNDQLNLYTEIVDKKLSVRQTEERVKALKNNNKTKKGSTKAIQKSDASLTQKLECPVFIKSNSKGGGILQIKFKNPQEFDALRKKILGED
jgi:ParB family chromosome partitioning protein